MFQDGYKSVILSNMSSRYSIGFGFFMHAKKDLELKKTYSK